MHRYREFGLVSDTDETLRRAFGTASSAPACRTSSFSMRSDGIAITPAPASTKPA
jgi:hypothetical protein